MSNVYHITTSISVAAAFLGMMSVSHQTYYNKQFIDISKFGEILNKGCN